MLKLFTATSTAALFIATCSHAATLTATFDDQALIGGSTTAPNDIISLVVEDILGGGVSITATALLADPGIGSFYIGGFNAADFSGAAGLLDAPSFNVYSSNIVTGGVVFGTDVSTFDGATISFTTVRNALTTADFSGLEVGFISTSANSPNTLQALFGGDLSVSDMTPVAAVPLPAGFPLMIAGVAGLGIVGRCKRSADKS